MALLSQVLTSPTVLAASALVALAGYFLIVHLRLRHVPGPFLASLSNFQRLAYVCTYRAQEFVTELHRKHGRIVRIGPNVVSINEPAEIGNILHHNNRFLKSDFYDVFNVTSDGKEIVSIFSTRNKDEHWAMKKPIASLYSMSSMVVYEPRVDSTIRTFFSVLDERFALPNLAVDMSLWLHRFAFDVIGEITFSRRLGFLETASDIDGIMKNIRRFVSYGCRAGQVPWFDWMWRRSSLGRRLVRPAPDPMFLFTAARIAEREDKTKGLSGDFLADFLRVQKEGSFPAGLIMTWTIQNVGAGSDTTASTLTAVLYYLLKNPNCYRLVCEEIDTIVDEDSLVVSWHQARKMPYLDACIKETERLAPAVSLPLERVVPPGGAVICGEMLPEGTIVGLNPWLLNRNQQIFGDDAEVWRPERWLACEEDNRKRMENTLLTFGHGSRVCIGRYVAELEIYKLIPSLLRRYEIELVDRNAEAKVENEWFLYLSGLNVRLKARKTGGSEAAQRIY